MAWQSEPFTSSSGANLNLYSGQPGGTGKAPVTRKGPGTCKGIVHINHGMAEHAGRYARFAAALNASGYAVYAQDHRGHGKTSAPGVAPGMFDRSDGWEKVMRDVADVNAHIAALHPGLPIICFGHSMGSIIAFNHILRAPQSIAGAALWNSGVDAGALAFVYGSILKLQRMFKGSDVPSGIAKKLTIETWNKQFAPNRTESDWLSRDEAEVDKYVADPLCGFDVTIGLWLDLLKGIYFAASDQNLARLPITLPIHLQAGSEDPCSEKGAAVQRIEKRMRAQGMQDVTLEMIEGARHESLNELERDNTTAKFIAWLDARFG